MIATKRSKESKNKNSLIEKKRRCKETLAAGLPLLSCLVCGFESTNSLISHIIKKHKMSMTDYRQSYPDARVQQASPTQRKNSSYVMKNKLLNSDALEVFMEWRSFPSEVKHWLKKGFTEEEAKEKITEFQKNQSLKGNNETTRLKRSQKCAGTKNPMSLISIANRQGVNIEIAREMTPCFGRTGSKHPMFGKKHTNETLRKIGESINHSGRSKIEHEMSDLLIELYGGDKNVGVIGWCCDYVNYEKRLIVEFFGDFWHHNPEKYSEDFVNGFTKRTSSQVWERDARKLKELREHGYEVIVVWESDWRKDNKTCLQRINDAYHRTS